MLSSHHLRITLAMLLLWLPTLQAQRISVGPIAQGSINVPYASFPSWSDNPLCCSEFGIGVGLMGVLGMELNAELIPGLSFSMQAGAGGVNDLVWTRDQIGWRMVRSATGNKVYPAYSTYYLDITGTLVDAAMLAHIKPDASSSWSFILGGAMVWPLALEYDQYELFDGDAASILSDSRRPQRDVSAGTVSSDAKPYARAITGLRHEQRISPSTRLVYDLTAVLAVTPLLTSGSGAYSRHGLRASIGLLFDLTGETSKAPAIVNDEPIASVVQVDTLPTTPSTPFTDTIALVTERTPVVQEPVPAVESAVVPPPPAAVLEPKPEPVVHDQTIQYLDLTTAYQLLPYIFFVPGTTEIDEKCHDRKPMLDVERLFDTTWTPDGYTVRHEALNKHLLDVIGYRMSREYPQAHLVVRGYINGRPSDSGVTKYGYARARKVTQYLQQHWGIESGRLQASSSESMSPTACTYALRDERDILDAEEENTRCEISSPNEPRLMASVLATVRVSQSDLAKTQQTAIVRVMSLPVLDAATVVATGAPPPGTATTLTAITGYTDRKGPQSINQRISEQRARKAATLIGAQSGMLTIDWIGEGARGMRAPYTNDSPLGRLLNRCAELRRTWVSSQR